MSIAVGYTVGKRIRKMGNKVLKIVTFGNEVLKQKAVEVSTKEFVKPIDVGFENYGNKKKFSIDKMAHKTVLITGAGSYIGESFAKYVKIYYPNITITTLDMKDEGWKKYTFTTADGNPFDTVFHVAGIAHADVRYKRIEEQELYYKVNTELAIECGRKSREAGVKQFIFMSSMIIYGGVEYIDEHTIPKPANFYGYSKWLADLGVRKLDNENFRVAVLRSPMIYGRGSKGNYQKLSKIAKTCHFFPSVNNKRSMLYVENLCEFVSLLALSGERGVFFPQNNEYSNTSEIVKMIGAVTRSPMFVSKTLSLAVSVAKKVPIEKVRSYVNKAFESSYYAMNLSRYTGMDYQIVNLEESIRRTEG